jgi:hypothetical protein
MSERPKPRPNEQLRQTTTKLQERLAEILNTNPSQLLLLCEDELLSSTSLGQHLDQRGWFFPNQLPRTLISLVSHRRFQLQQGSPIDPQLLVNHEDVCYVHCLDLSDFDPEAAIETGEPPHTHTYPYITFAYQHPLSDDILSHFLPPTHPSHTHTETHF